MIRILDSASTTRPIARHSSSARNAVFATAIAICISLMLALSGCGREAQPPGSVDAGPSERSTDDAVAIVIDGREITVAEVNEHMKNQFMEEFSRQSDDKQFELRENAARDLIQSIVIGAEAKKRGISTDELFAEIADSASPPTDEEVATWYSQNHSRLRGALLEDVSSQIKQHLTNERQVQALEDFLDPRLEAMSMRMVLSPPRKVLDATRLARGPVDAPITIITFSDYQCPYCILAEPVLTEVLSRYPERVRVVHRHFPLDSIHPFARPAAEAAMCAEEQGKFWEYHQAIFDLNGKLVEGSLAGIGSSLGLDREKLSSCIEERRFKDFVEADFAAGREAGVTGTPSFFINGITFTGSRDADEMSRQIDRELARIEGS